MKIINYEYFEPKDEYGTFPEEYVKPDADEFASAFSAAEFSKAADEYAPVGSEEYSGITKSAETGDPGRGGKLKKMVYMIASAATAVVIATTALTANNAATPTAAVLYSDKYVDVSDFAAVGAAGGGALTLQRADKSFILTDYNLKVLFEPDSESRILSHPTEDGYTLAEDGDSIFVLDNKGKRRTEIDKEDLYDETIGKLAKELDFASYMFFVDYESVGNCIGFAGLSEDVIFIMLDLNMFNGIPKKGYDLDHDSVYDNFYNDRMYIYYDLDGNIIYKTHPQRELNEQADDEQFMGATYFNGGYAYFMEDMAFKRIDKKGNVKVIADWDDPTLTPSETKLEDTPFEVLMNFSGDWFLGQLPHSDYDWILVNIKTGEAFNCNMNYNNIMPNADGTGLSWGVLGIVYHSIYQDIYEDDRFYIPFSPYYKDGAMHYNIGTFAARNFVAGDGFVQASITNYKNMDEESGKTKIVAWYDEIYASPDETFLIYNENEFFFVDTQNKVLSDKYYKASTFTTTGYAIVIDKKGGKARLINTDYETISVLDNVDDVAIDSHGQGIQVYYKGKMSVIIPRVGEDGTVQNAADAKPVETSKSSSTSKPSSTSSPSSTSEAGSVVDDILDYHPSYMGNYEEDPGMEAVSVYDPTEMFFDNYAGYGMPSSVVIDIPDPDDVDGFTFLGYVVYCDYYADENGNRYVTRVCPLKDGNFDYWEFQHLKVGDRGDDVEIHGSWRPTDQSDVKTHHLYLNANGGDFGEEYEEKTEISFDVTSPAGSASKVYLCTYPEPVRDGYEFAGWYMEGSDDEVFLLDAADFIKWNEGDDGEMHPDWNTKVDNKLYAKWVKK